MTFTRLVLHNFGAYCGEHVCEFRTDAKTRPVVLIGGMNGAGKSTIIDAIQLALIGKLARCAGRRESSYDEFLRRAINRDAIPRETRIQLEFVSRISGQQTQVCLDRSWVEVDGRVRERFEVRRDGVVDCVLTEHWLEHLDHWLPHSLSQVFFFDGEQLEALADAATSAVVLRSAVEGLLGIDLIGRLAADLTILERRRESELLPDNEQRELEALERQRAAVADTRRKVRQEQAAAENAVRDCTRELVAVEDKLASEGGTPFERRGKLELHQRHLETQIASVEQQLRDVADGPAPLLLVPSQLDDVACQLQRERGAEESMVVDAVLTERDEWLLKHLKSAQLADQTLSEVRVALHADRARRAAPAVEPSYLEAPRELQDLLAGLKQETLPVLRERLAGLLGEWQRTTEALEVAARQIATIPSAEAIAHVLATRDERRIALRAAESRLATLTQELERLDRDHDRAEAEVDTWRKAHVQKARDADDATRAIVHIHRVRGTLGRFREALLQRHARRIESLALDSLRQLLRKERLVHDLRIDPRTFAVSICGMDGHDIPVERLSAGERQLLATALLWGVRRAAGRVVPLVIDTRLVRLDSSHRKHLVTRYFPHASHQTILLSTDQEITGEYYDALRPWIGTEYTLTNDERGLSSTITSGYFSTVPEEPTHVT